MDNEKISKMDEQILNYIDMSEEQRINALKALKSIGFYPAYGTEKTMRRIMDKSVSGEIPQFYFVFRKDRLIGYLFIIGDDQKYKAFPWLAVTNIDELPMDITRFLMDILIKACNGNANMADLAEKLLAEYEIRSGHRPDDLCR